MAIQAMTPPVEPVTLDEIKLHCRIDHDSEDDYIQGLIRAAREYCETASGRAFVERDILYTLDRWPSRRFIVLPRPPVADVVSVEYILPNGTATPFTDFTADTLNGRIVLDEGYSWPTAQMHPVNPIQITYTAGYDKIAGQVATGEAVGTGDGTNKTFNLLYPPIVSGSLTVKVAGVTVTAYTVNLVTGEIVFTSAPTAGQAVTADYEQETDYTSNIPESYKAAVKLCVGSWYENREAVLPAGHIGRTLPMGVDHLLWQDRYIWTEDFNR